MKTNKTLKVIGSAALMASSSTPQTMVVFAEEPAQEVKETSQPKTQVLMKDLETAIQNETKAQQKVETIEQELNTTYTEIAGAQETYNEVMTQRIEQEEAIDETLVQQLAESTAQLENLEAQYEQSMKEKEELESELAQKQTQLEQEEAKLAEAEQELEQAKAEYEAVDTTALKEAKQTVLDTSNELVSLNQTSEQIKLELQDAQKEYQAQAEMVELLQSAYNETLASLPGAQVAYDQALAVQAEKEALLAIAEDEETYVLAQSELEAAKNAVGEAYILVQQSQQEIANAEIQLANAQTQLEQAAQKLPDYEQAIADAETKVTEAQAKYEEAQAALKQAEADSAEKEELKNKAQIALENAQAEVDRQNEAIANAQKQVDDTQAKLDELYSQVGLDVEWIQQLEKKLVGLQKQYASGSLGFFQALPDIQDVQSAIAILQDNRIPEYTNLGAEGDATSLENMKASLIWIKECNRIRTGLGLNELKVSATAMAVAQKQLNYSNDKYEHSSAYGYGENLAWAYDDPFKAWYDNEKVVYEKYLDQGLSVDEIQKNHLNEVGHYLNIIHPGYTTTGFAINTTGNKYGNISYGQVFTGGKASFTVDNFEYNLNKYEHGITETMKSIQEAIDEERNRDLEVTAEIEQAEAELETKKQELENQKRLLQQKQASFALVESDYETASTILNNSYDAIILAQMELNSKNDAIDQAKAGVEQKQAEMNAYLNSDELKGFHKNFVAWQGNLNTAKANHQTHNGTYLSLQSIANEKQEKLNSLERLIDQARNDLSDAQNDANAKKSVLERIQAGIAEGAQNLETRNALKSKAEAEAARISAQLDSTTAKIKDLENILGEAQAIYNELDGYRVRYEEAVYAKGQTEDTIKNLNTALPVLRSSIDSLNGQINENNVKQVEAKSYLADVNKAKNAWAAIQNGQPASFASIYPSLAMLPGVFEKYQTLKNNEFLAKANLESLIADADTSVETLRQAKTNYELAKDARIKAEKALEDFFASIDDKKAIVIDTNKKDQTTKDEKTAKDESSEKEDSSKKEEKVATTVNTAAETGLFVYTAGTVLSGALAAAFLKRKKD